MSTHSDDFTYAGSMREEQNILKSIVRSVAALVLGSMFDWAAAATPVWGLIEVYSNTDRSIQFVVHATPDSGQQYLGGFTLVAEGEGGVTHHFTFPRDLPGESAGHSFLIATQGFADLHVLQPDYVVPNGFFSVSGGVIRVADHGYAYPSVPTDGVKAFWQDPDFISWYASAVAENFSGGRYAFAASPAPPPSPPPPPPPQPPRPTPLLLVPVIEYYHAAFDHYFVTANPDEIVKVDSGVFSGWTRTGFQFNAYATPRADTFPVCRFFSTAFEPKSSHFYTPFAFECTKVQANTDWLFESPAAFNIAIPTVDGSCAVGTLPVYRLYNDGQRGAPNHRYTTDFHERAKMLAQGWVPEGLGADAVEMCS